MVCKNEHGLLNNFIWKFLERISAQLVTLLVSVILARILSPEDYGIIAIVNIFIAFANVFVAYGFGNSLIQKKDVNALDYSTVLFFNIGLTFFLYLTLFFLAPLISAFYGKGYEILTPVLRVLGLRLILSGINSVQQAYVAQKMIFKKFFVATLSGTIISAIVGIIMALTGFGIWALVAQSLLSPIINTVVLTISLKKKVIFAFSISRLKSLWSFGSYMLLSGILMTFFEELRALLIGKVYTSKDLAYYDKGKQFPNIIVSNTTTSLSSVLFPKMSKEQDEISVLKETMRKTIRFSSFIMSPLLLGLFAVSESFVCLLLTPKWLPCVPLLQSFCIYYLFQPMHAVNTQAIKAMGKSRLFLRLEIIKKVIEFIVLICTIRISVSAMAYSMAGLSILFTFLNAYPNVKFLKYTFKEQFSDILPSIFSSALMCIGVVLLGGIPTNDFIKLLIQILFGSTFYILVSHISKSEELKYLFGLIKNKLSYKKETKND